MKLALALAVVAGLAAASAGLARADAREDQAKEVRDEIATQRMDSCSVGYGVRAPCGSKDVCAKVKEVITSFQTDMDSPETQKGAVYRMFRFLSRDTSEAACVRELVSTNTYCKIVALVQAFDPHQNCPSEGGTNATCWFNRAWETSPLLLKGEEIDWYQSCRTSK